MQEKETVYLAGKITGDPEYRAKFERAQRKLENSGFIVLNPAGLPSEGFTYTVATIEVIIDKLRVFGGDVSGFCAVEHYGESGLAFVFSALQHDFGGVLVEGFVLPVKAAQNRLTAFVSVLKGNARDLRSYEFVFIFEGIGESWSGCARFLRLLGLPVPDEGKRGGNRNAASKFADPVRKERERADKEQRGGDP